MVRLDEAVLAVQAEAKEFPVWIYFIEYLVGIDFCAGCKNAEIEVFGQFEQTLGEAGPDVDVDGGVAVSFLHHDLLVVVEEGGLVLIERMDQRFV